MRYVLLFSLAFSFCFCTQWIVDEQLLKQVLPKDVPLEELIATIKDEGVDLVFQEHPAETILWKGNYTTIYLSSHPQVPYHLWLESTASSLEECTPEEWTDLYQAIWMTKKVFRTTLGANGFVFASTDHPRLGKNSDRFGMELLPCIDKDPDRAIDASEKAFINEYMFFNIPCPAKDVDKVDIVSLQKAFEEASFDPMIVPVDQKEKWTQKNFRHKRAASLLLQQIFENLKSNHVLISGEMPLEVPDDTISEILINNDVCAFCNPKVISRQKVTEYGGMFLLCDHKPLSSMGSFLILPKRHQVSFELTKSEMLATLELLKSLKASILERNGPKEVIFYFQDGLGAGQTVPHTLIHMLPIPSRMKISLSGLQHMKNTRRALPTEQLRMICDGYEQDLSGKLTPTALR